MFEKIAAAIISVIAVYFLYKSIKKKTSGKCDCDSCSSHCPFYETQNKNEHK